MTQIPIFVRLRTTEQLSREDALGWHRLVKSTLQPGLTTGVQTTDPQGDPDVVFMVRKKTKGGENLYEIPLTRDLTEEEQDQLTQACQLGVVETSAIHPVSARNGPQDAVVMDEDQYDALCESLAKHQHQRWYDDRARAGWSYGLTLDESTQRHPMMRPWEDLPREYRKVDYELPHLFMNMLSQQGYVVVSRQELNDWLDRR